MIKLKRYCTPKWAFLSYKTKLFDYTVIKRVLDAGVNINKFTIFHTFCAIRCLKSSKHADKEATVSTSCNE